jgi:hypothetical protein
MDSQTKMLAEAETKWKGITLTVGQLLLPLLVGATENGQGLLDVFENFFNILKQSAAIMQYMGDNGKDNPFREWALTLGEDNPFRKWAEYLDSTVDPKVNSKLKAWKNAMDTYFPSVKGVDKPTGVGGATNAVPEITADQQDKLKDKIKSLGDDIVDLGRKARETEADFQKLWSTNPSKLGREIQDFLHDLAGISDESNQKIADANRKHRQNEINEEAKFQEQMRQLKEKYLYNLEDALRERDARQVLRLQAQYGMDKTAAQNEHDLKKSEDDAALAAEIAQIKSDRDKRMEEMRYEFELKKQRAAEDHAIEMQRMEQDRQDKIRAMADAIAQELGMGQDGANAMYNMLSGIYGTNGSIGRLFDATYAKVVSNAEATYNKIKEYADKYKKISMSMSAGTTAPSGGGSGGGGGKKVGGTYGLLGPTSTPMANGGMIVASKPTNVTFGEAGSEAALFLPLNKLSALMGAAGGGINNQGGNGKMELIVTLSPDLEAKIVNKSMNELSNIVVGIGQER